DAQTPRPGQTLGRRSTLRIDSEQEPLGAEAEPDRLEQSLRNQRHRPTLIAADVASRVDPLEIRRGSIHLDVQETVRLIVDRPVRDGLRDRREQDAGWVAVEQGKNVAQVLAEEVIEEGVERARVIVAIPPEPVRALGDVELIPGARQGVRV